MEKYKKVKLFIPKRHEEIRCPRFFDDSFQLEFYPNQSTTNPAGAGILDLLHFNFFEKLYEN